jgi:outer membrane receptor protein involved in Fe transport
MKTTTFIFLFFFGLFGYSQTSVSGTVMDESGQHLPGANVVVVGTTTGTVTDFDGKFLLTVSQDPPFTLQVSSVGFGTERFDVTSNNQVVEIILKEGTALDEIVVSASRTPERIFESPVTIERFGYKEIKNTASVDFYEGLENLKGVDVNTNSLTFKSVNTRGFATFSNTRFMQLVDGMDNSTPALNFPIGNLVGMIETDVQSVELLPGAASALYGANAFNGILFMTSKSPFDHQGISAHIKKGITSQESAGDNNYTDFGIRGAYKFSEKFAAKINFGWLKGTDWQATSEKDRFNRGLTRADLDYDGINVYGDEVSTNIKGVADALVDLDLLPAAALALVPSVNVSRTGYNERDLTPYKAESIKTDWGLYYRPWENDFEIQYVGKVGTGTTIYQGTNRYNIDAFSQEQHKLEVRNDNFFVRGYLVADKAGDSYDMVFTGININRAWKDDETWFGEYVGAYVTSTLGGSNDTEAHVYARKVADEVIDPAGEEDNVERFLPGTPEYQEAFNQSISDPNLSTGSKFQDASKYYHADANYNFGHLIEEVEIQLGGSYRKYRLNSSGTIYTDAEGPIRYTEFGIYTQLQKSFELSDVVDLKLTGSVRYDKSELYDGFLSPRLSAGFTINENHNVRVSVQTGFKNPTTQDLYIGLDAGRAILVGSAPDNPARYSRDYDISIDGRELGFPNSITQTGEAAYENSYQAQSVIEFGDRDSENFGDPSVLRPANSSFVDTEKLTSYELGYRGKLGKTVIDASIYYNKYKDFLANEQVVAPLYGEVGDDLSVLALVNEDFVIYQTYTNSVADVNAYGAAISVSTKVFGNFDLSANYSFIEQDFDRDRFPDFRTNFNTPEHRVKASFGNTNLLENFGFNIAWRWSDRFFWEAAFGDGIVPSYHTLDAQFNLNLPGMNSNFKAGATNILGDEYFTAFGSGFIGSMYYIGLTINN